MRRVKGPWRVFYQVFKALLGSKTEKRELLGGMEENSGSPRRSHWFFNLPLILDFLRPPWMKLWCYQTLTQTEIKHISSRHEAVKESPLQRVCRSRKFQSSLPEQFMWHCIALQKIFCPLTVWNFTPIHTNRWKWKFFNANLCKDRPLHKSKIFEKPTHRFLHQFLINLGCVRAAGLPKFLFVKRGLWAKSLVHTNYEGYVSIIYHVVWAWNWQF